MTYRTRREEIGIRNKVRCLVASYLELTEYDVKKLCNPHTRLEEDLGVDSLSCFGMPGYIEDHFSIAPNDAIRQCVTIGDLKQYVLNHCDAKPR